MAEKIEFIPANELPVAEGDEVSVLCLENGEMKQKPASGLGGKSNVTLQIRGTWIMDENGDREVSYESVSAETFEAIKNDLLHANPVTIALSEQFKRYEGDELVVECYGYSVKEVGYYPVCFGLPEHIQIGMEYLVMTADGSIMSYYQFDN